MVHKEDLVQLQKQYLMFLPPNALHSRFWALPEAGRLSAASQLLHAPSRLAQPPSHSGLPPPRLLVVSAVQGQPAGELGLRAAHRHLRH